MTHKPMAPVRNSSGTPTELRSGPRTPSALCTHPQRKHASQARSVGARRRHAAQAHRNVAEAADVAARSVVLVEALVGRHTG